MIYIDSNNTDPYFNLAFEEFVFEKLDKKKSYCMLWQNYNTIVVGKHQNTIEEINKEYVDQHGIKVVRRLSGGGAVYHDEGNMNFTFIVDEENSDDFDFEIFTRPIVKALEVMGVKAEFSSRNDLTIDGKKFSGNSQYMKHGRVLHHGTLMFNSNINRVTDALKVKPDKIVSKGIQSVRSRVTNILDYLPKPITMDEFKKTLIKYMFETSNFEKYELTSEDVKAIEKIRDSKYKTYEWNYGKSPKYNIKKDRKFDFGLVSVLMDVSEGVINNISIFGDFFGNGEMQILEKLLIGKKIVFNDVYESVKDVDLKYYISGMSLEQFASLIVY